MTLRLEPGNLCCHSACTGYVTIYPVCDPYSSPLNSCPPALKVPPNQPESLADTGWQRRASLVVECSLWEVSSSQVPRVQG